MTRVDELPAGGEGMKDRSLLAASCVEVAGYLQFPLGVLISLALLAGRSRWSVGVSVFVLLLSFASAGFAVLSGKWLRKGQTRGWTSGLVLSGLYLPSLFLPLAVVMLWALLSKGTRHRYFSREKQT